MSASASASEFHGDVYAFDTKAEMEPVVVSRPAPGTLAVEFPPLDPDSDLDSWLNRVVAGQLKLKLKMEVIG